MNRVVLVTFFVLSLSLSACSTLIETTSPDESRTAAQPPIVVVEQPPPQPTQDPGVPVEVVNTLLNNQADVNAQAAERIAQENAANRSQMDAYLQSAQEERRQQLLIGGAIVVLLIVAGVAGFGIWQRNKTMQVKAEAQKAQAQREMLAIATSIVQQPVQVPQWSGQSGVVFDPSQGFVDFSQQNAAQPGFTIVNPAALPLWKGARLPPPSSNGGGE